MHCTVIFLFLAFSGSVQSFAPRFAGSRVQPPVVRMVAMSPDGFEELPENQMDRQFGKGKVNDAEKKGKFVNGDELHKLRHHVMAMRLELQEARRTGSELLVRALEQSIRNAQQSDAEWIWAVETERQVKAEEKGRFHEAEKHRKLATEARNALPQFGLEGLWVGKYGEEQGYEMINVTYAGDVLVATKVTGSKNVPKGQVTFEVDLNPRPEREILEPIKLGESAARQWGSKYLQRFLGKGQISAAGFEDSQFVQGNLILVNEYFSFAWLPIGHQVFFGRPTPELVLKLLKDDQNQSDERQFLEKCWDETQHIDDHREVTEGFVSSDETDYFHQDGCFE
mmetsp:Transcript_21884/g.54094  ORF Transcript_21884/g.54094 Transcript_21884/m.54094 type:complete len:339 (+) Transcript_21884:126-1142(+)